MVKIYTHPQVFGLETHPLWPHIPNMTQYGSAPWALMYCLIREESLDIAKEFRIGDLTSYSDHTILNIESVSDKSIEDEFPKVQSKNAKQKLESHDDISP